MPLFTTKYPSKEIYVKRDVDTLIDLIQERFNKQSFFDDSLFASEWFKTNAELIRWAFEDQNQKQVYSILKEKIAARNITALKMRNILQAKVNPVQKKYLYLASELFRIVTDDAIIKKMPKSNSELYFELLFCLYNGRMSRFEEIIYTEESAISVKHFFINYTFSFENVIGNTGKAVQKDFAELYVPYSSLPLQAGSKEPEYYMYIIHKVCYKVDVLERFILGDDYFDTWAKSEVEIQIEKFLRIAYDTNEEKEAFYQDYLLAYEKFRDETKFRKICKKKASKNHPELQIPKDATLLHLEKRWNNYRLRTEN